MNQIVNFKLVDMGSYVIATPISIKVNLTLYPLVKTGRGYRYEINGEAYYI